MGGGTLATDAVLVDPSGSVTSVTLPAPRAFAVATRLAGGNVLITGGSDTTGVVATALLYDAGAKTFSMLAPSGDGRAAMQVPRGVAHRDAPAVGRGVHLRRQRRPRVGRQHRAVDARHGRLRRHARVQPAAARARLRDRADRRHRGARRRRDLAAAAGQSVAGARSDRLSPGAGHGDRRARRRSDRRLGARRGHLDDARSTAACSTSAAAWPTRARSPAGPRLFVPCFGTCLDITP